MVLGLESIPFMKLTASVSFDLQKSQKPAAVVSKIGENWDMPALDFFGSGAPLMIFHRHEGT